MNAKRLLGAGCSVLLAATASAKTRLAETPVAITVLDDSQLAATPLNVSDLLKELPGAFGSGGAEAVFTDRLRLNFDSSFTGEDRLRVRLGGGYHGDPYERDEDSSSFLSGGVSYGLGFGSGPTQGLLALGAGVTHYTDDLPARDGDDQTIHDFEGILGVTHDFSESTRLENLTRVNFGGHGSIARGYLRSGILERNTLDWHSNTALHFRFDGQPLGSRGWGFSIAAEFGGFAEDGRDEVDSWRLRYTGEVRYNLNEHLTILFDGSYGAREWQELDDFDMHDFTVGGGVRGEIRDTTYTVRAGFHHREYDALDDPDEAYANLTLAGPLGGNLSYGLIADYGVQDVFPERGGIDFIDPIGFRGGGRITCSCNERVDVSLLANYMEVKSDFVPAIVSGDHVSRLAVGLEADIEISDGVTLTPGLLWINADDDGAGDTDFVVGAIRTTFRF